MTPIEKKEIRGLTIGWLWFAVASLLTVEASVLGTYYKAMSRMDNSDEKSKVVEIQANTNRLRLEALDKDLAAVLLRLAVIDEKLRAYEKNK